MKKNSAYQSLQKKRKEKSDSYSIDVGDDDDDDLEDEYGYGYGYNDEYDSQDDGFIVDEDEEGENMAAAAKAARRQRRDYDNMRSQGYSKDEIWEIFNRGKKRSYYDRYDDYDSDDMEATGTEILEDEERTLKQAKLDDLREQKLLAQKALQKRKITKKHWASTTGFRIIEIIICWILALIYCLILVTILKLVILVFVATLGFNILLFYCFTFISDRRTVMGLNTII